MKKLIFILIAGFFIFAAGAAENVSAQKPLCSNTRCKTLETCQRQPNFQCVRGGGEGCFNYFCGRIGPIQERKAFTTKVRSGNFVSTDGIKVTNKVSAPLTAVFVVEDKYWVYVMKGGNVLKRAVMVGEVGEDNIEITKGLKSGDVIVKNPLAIAQRNNKK